MSTAITGETVLAAVTAQEIRRHLGIPGIQSSPTSTEGLREADRQFAEVQRRLGELTPEDRHELVRQCKARAQDRLAKEAADAGAAAALKRWGSFETAATAALGALAHAVTALNALTPGDSLVATTPGASDLVTKFQKLNAAAAA